MLPSSKQKRKSKEQPHIVDGKYNIKKICNDSWDFLMLKVSYNNDDSSDFFSDSSYYFNDDPDFFNDNGSSSSNCMVVFAFDNSSNHAAFSKDVLVTNQINLNSGDKQPVMRNIYFKPNNQLQSMVFLTTYNDEKLRGKPKGIKQVLMECEKWPSGGLDFRSFTLNIGYCY
ncbi:hypothetical protein C1646_775415 [Rhizophagus diaphanus]|nr:hypothetical protein C1646_775415 [Rhizophagus diaphanus] [Rhizophagus sp. MUCL 43196]